jgi:hypothetical protein
VFRKQPTRCDQQPFDGPKTNFPKDPSSWRVKDPGGPFQHGPDEESVTYLRILGLFYVELTMSCYFKLALPTTRLFIASLDHNKASRIIRTCAPQSLLIINYLCKFKLHERVKQSLLCHMLNNLFGAFLGLSFVHYMLLCDFIFLRALIGAFLDLSLVL